MDKTGIAISGVLNAYARNDLGQLGIHFEEK